jgi:DNA-binding XRE family transcriptional regulator
MRIRIEKIIAESGMNPSAFADFIGVNRATMIQTLKRNDKASINVIIPILVKYPRINPDWLLFGKDPMYRDEKTIIVNHPVNTAKKELNIFDENYKTTATNISDKQEYTKEIEAKKEEIISKQTKFQSVIPELSLSENIDEIIVFFKDKTFVTFKPEK